MFNENFTEDKKSSEETSPKEVEYFGLEAFSKPPKESEKLAVDEKETDESKKSLVTAGETETKECLQENINAHKYYGAESDIDTNEIYMSHDWEEGIDSILNLNDLDTKNPLQRQIQPVRKTLDEEIRLYQRELSEPGVEGKNTIIVAPTNTGKTHVALKIMQVHFDSASTNVHVMTVFT